jgi:multidrug transporter EmrE-like cation transporter
MNAASLALILTGVLLNAAAQLLLKAGANAVGSFAFTPSNILHAGFEFARQWPILGGLACYVVSVVVWVLGLTRVDVSMAYPLLSLGYVINAVAAWYLFGEAVGPQRMIGIAVIIVGVVLVARS